MNSNLQFDGSIGLCSDHAGYELKEQVKAWLDELGLAYVDFGTGSTDSCDYADYAHPCACAVEDGRCAGAIAICGTGNGIGITLNKHQGVRAALCWEPEIARLGRAHNNANVLVMPARFVSVETAHAMVDVFLREPFEGGRHERRIEKIPVRK